LEDENMTLQLLVFLLSPPFTQHQILSPEQKIVSVKLNRKKKKKGENIQFSPVSCPFQGENLRDCHGLHKCYYIG